MIAPGMATRAPTRLTHFDASGSARMVDVGDKASTHRVAVASGRIAMRPATFRLIASGRAKKGDVLGIARIAAIQAAKRTDELIPLAHPLPIDFVDVRAQIDTDAGTVTLTAEARTTAKTGVEMEAMTACAVAALTLYDMVKGIERGIVIDELTLLEKTGGKQDWKRE